MILLTSTSDLVQLVSGSTSVLQVQASFVDLSGSTVTPGRTNTSINSATTTTIVGSPGSSTQRTVKFLSVFNTGASETVTIQHTDNVTPVKLFSITLGSGWSIVYNEGSGWTVYDASGNAQQSIGPGRFLKRTVILNGTTVFTTRADTTSIIARMVAGGGQGGGGGATTGFDGSGGGAGSYAEWQVAVSPSTAYTVAVGAGGTTGGTGAGGQTGGITTFAVGGTTVTCNGGLGGLAGTSAAVPVVGGAGGAISTNGTTNIPGAAGMQSYGSTALDNGSGSGANSQLGNGGQQKANISAATGNAAGGFGAGGGGGTTTGVATAGGAGSNGVIIVDEYS